MEYRMDKLTERVDNLESFIVGIEYRINIVLDEFFTHRAKQAADVCQKSQDEEALCLSLLSKFKTAFIVPENRREPTPSPVRTSTPPAAHVNSGPSPSLPGHSPAASITSPSPGLIQSNPMLAGILSQGVPIPEPANNELLKRALTAEDEEGPNDEFGDQDDMEQQEEAVDGEADLIVSHVYGNYTADSDPDPDNGSDAADTEDEDNEEGNALDEDPLHSDTEEITANYSTNTNNEESDLSMVCDPEVFIKTEGNGPRTRNREAHASEDIDNADQEQQQSSSTSNNKSNPEYRRVRAFANVDQGKIFLKTNGMCCGSNHEATDAKRYYYRCKDKLCPMRMTLAENYITGRTVLFEKKVEHTHPPIYVDLTPKTPGSSGSKPAAAKIEPTFKLIQTFPHRAEAMAQIQATDPGAWVLSQMVEAPDSVKAYYNCGLHSGHSCPMSMVLRTFNENGKVDQYIWQGGHVYGEAAEGKSFADYFTPPASVHRHTGKHQGRTFNRVREFDTEEEAKADAAADTSARWDLRNTQHTIQGKKLYYYCKHRKCPITMYLQLVTMAGKVFQYISEGQHDHSHPEKQPKSINPAKAKPGNPQAKEWATVAKFSSEDAARSHVRNELAWAFRNSSRHPSGSKRMYYLCKHDPKCPVRCVLDVDTTTGATTMLVTTKEAHVHNAPPRPHIGRGGKPVKLAPELRAVMDELYAAGLTTVEKILKELVRRGTPAPPYHVFGYLARLRKMRMLNSRRLKKAVQQPQTRILSGNPKNERIRAKAAAKEAAKRATGGESEAAGAGYTPHAVLMSSSPMRLSMVSEDTDTMDSKERVRQLCSGLKNAVIRVKRLDM